LKIITSHQVYDIRIMLLKIIEQIIMDILFKNNFNLQIAGFWGFGEQLVNGFWAIPSTVRIAPQNPKTPKPQFN